MRIYKIITATLYILFVSSLFAAGVRAEEPNNCPAQKPKIEFCEDCQAKIDAFRAEVQERGKQLRRERNAKGVKRSQGRK